MASLFLPLLSLLAALLAAEAVVIDLNSENFDQVPVHANVRAVVGVLGPPL